MTGKTNSIIEKGIISDTVSEIWTGTQEEYDAIIYKDNTILYIIVKGSNGV